MSAISDLLREADPLSREAMWSPERRLTTRQAVLAAPSAAAASRKAGLPLMAIAALTLLLIAAIALFPRPWSTPVQAAVRFELRLAESAPGVGLEEGTLLLSGQTIYLHREAVANNIDIAAARVVPGNRPSTFAVDVRFTPSAAERLARVTRDHIGKPVAILIDGKVVMAPVLKSPISGNALINGDFSQSEADRVANGMIGQ